jgi:hypothetical protein
VFVVITTSELVGRLTRWKLAIKKEWPGGRIGGEEHILSFSINYLQLNKFIGIIR